ncbi:restriction endonuclease subunit S [Yersinia enterocolitica]
MSVNNKVPEIRFKGFSGEWAEETLGAVAEIKTGPFGSTLHAKAYVEDGHAIITTEHFKSGELPVDKKGIPQVSDDDYLRLKAYLLKVGDIVFSRVGSVDINAHVKNKQKGWLFSGRVLRVRSGKIIDSEYLHHELSTSRVKKSVVSRAVGQTMPSINTEILKITPIHFPLYTTEQTAIGNYFQKLDSLINQHQQKHDKLSNIKKSMLEKMFPKQGHAIPEIRFKGFSGEWEEKPFGACFVNVQNNTLSRANLNYEDGMAKNIHYGDVLIKFGEVLDATNELLPFITNNDVANKLKHAALRDGDIIIADAAEDSMVGKCTELFNIDGQLVLSGLHTIAVRPTLSFAYKYLGYYLNSSSYHDQLLSLMQGTKVLSISKTAIQNTNVAFPKSVEEQTAIGNYFQKLDVLINQHQQQITKLNNIKQACLSRMFI